MKLAKWKYETWPEYLERIIVGGWKDLICKIFGHAEPEQKLSCEICSRCRIILPWRPRNDE